MKIRKLSVIVLVVAMVCAIIAPTSLASENTESPSTYWIGGYAPLPSAPKPEGREKWANVTWAPSSGDGSPANPYIVDGVQAFGPGQMTWPQWNYIMGYAYGGGGQGTDPDPYPTYLPIVVIFEWKDAGKLLYSWKIDGNKPKSSIMLNAGGPVFLQVTQAYDDTTKVTSLSLRFYELHIGSDPYDFADYYPELTLNVAGHYEEGTVLKVNGPGANTSTATVNNGLINFGLNAGGDYTLTANPSQQPKTGGNNAPVTGTLQQPLDEPDEEAGEAHSLSKETISANDVSDALKAVAEAAVSKLAAASAKDYGADIKTVGNPVSVSPSGTGSTVTTIALPYTIGTSKITTMAVLSEDGELTPVPTRLDTDGKVTVLISGNVTLIPLNVQVKFTDTNFGGSYLKATEEIERAASLLIVKGVGSGRFAPNKPVTGQQGVTMFLRAMGIPIDYSSAMDTGKEYGLTGEGVTAGAPLTRIQTAELIVAALKNVGISIPLEEEETDSLLAAFKDISGLSAAERDNLAVCVKLGIYQGAGEDKMNPRSELQRSQMASLAVRLQDVIFLT